MDEVSDYSHAVDIIKAAVEQSRYRALHAGNAEMLSLYYGIGKYVSENTRNGAWGTDAIKQISVRLQKELPGMRGFSESNIKNMRQFYEEWAPYVNRQPVAVDLELDSKFLLAEIRQPAAGDLDWKEFLSIGFSHHMEIIAKVKDVDARIFYIHECANRAWDKYTLRDYIKSGLHQGADSLPNNFNTALTDTKFAIKATKAFKDNYLLFFNREINSLVAVELKTGKFKATYLGQLNTYLSILDDTVRKPHENPSVGIILCKDMNRSFVDYVIRDYDKPLGVATYKTSKEMADDLLKALPPVTELKKLLDDTKDDDLQ